MLEEIHCDFSDFSKEVIKGNTYDERKEILWRCYASNPTKEDLEKMTLEDIINYIRETDEFWLDDKKYVDACVALIKEKAGNKKGQQCCLCGDLFDGFGNNPYPLSKTGRCCDCCNATKVIPARLNWKN